MESSFRENAALASITAERSSRLHQQVSYNYECRYGVIECCADNPNWTVKQSGGLRTTADCTLPSRRSLSEQRVYDRLFYCELPFAIEKILRTLGELNRQLQPCINSRHRNHNGKENAFSRALSSRSAAINETERSGSYPTDLDSESLDDVEFDDGSVSYHSRTMSSSSAMSSTMFRLSNSSLSSSINGSNARCIYPGKPNRLESIRTDEELSLKPESFADNASPDNESIDQGFYGGVNVERKHRECHGIKNGHNVFSFSSSPKSSLFRGLRPFQSQRDFSSEIKHAPGLRNMSRPKNPKQYRLITGLCSGQSAVCYSSSKSLHMDVTVTMNGYEIKKSEIAVASPKKKSKNRMQQALKTVIRSSSPGSSTLRHFSTKLGEPHSRPLVLEQLFQVYDSSMRETDALEGLIDKINESAKRGPVVIEDSINAQYCIHGLLVSLINSRNTLSDPSKFIFPAVWRDDDNEYRSRFSPSPNDFIVEYSVHMTELIVAAYKIERLKTPVDSRNQLGDTEVDSIEASSPCTSWSDSWVPASELTDRVFRSGDNKHKLVKVVDQIQVHFELDSLRVVMNCLYEAYNVAIRVLRKLEAVNRHDIECLMRSEVDADTWSTYQTLSKKIDTISSLPEVQYSNRVA